MIAKRSRTRLAAILTTALIAATPALAWDTPATMRATVKVHEEPLLKARVLDVVEVGTAVQVLRCVPSRTWCKIRQPGRDGWVKEVAIDRMPILRGIFCKDPDRNIFCVLH